MQPDQPTRSAGPSPADEQQASDPRSLWRPGLIGAGLGLFALAFLLAFEALAVSTVMPQVAADLHGTSWYAIAFAAPIAVSVVALRAAGPWIDGRGPTGAMYVGTAVFAAGLVVAGLAGNMVVFLVGRGVQGFGSGVIGVGVYVLIARIYPAELRPKAFALLTAAWVLPGLVGPFVAATVARVAGWRWVFPGVPGLAVVALALLAPAMRRFVGERSDPTANPGRGPALRSVAVAVGVLLLSWGGQRNVGWWPGLVALGALLVLLAAPALLPRGSWRGHPGLPSVIGARGLLTAGYAAAEVYVPFSLISFHGLRPATAGAALTAAALTWSGGAWIGGRLPALSDYLVRTRFGLGAVGVGVILTSSVVLPAVTPAVVIVGWAVAGLGMGVAGPAISTLVLDLSDPGAAGANSAAAQINDAVVTGFGLAVGSAVFAALLPVEPHVAVAAALAVAVVLIALAWWPARRIGRVQRQATGPSVALSARTGPA